MARPDTAHKLGVPEPCPFSKILYIVMDYAQRGNA
jgi:hypothetical protein